MKNTSKVLALVLVVMTVLMSLSAITASAATETVTKVLEASSLGSNAQGTWTDGQEINAGTDDFFTLVMSAKAKTDGSKKTFSDGYYSETRISWGGKSTSSKNLIKFTVPSAATVKVWWVAGGADRTLALWDADGATVATGTNPTGSDILLDTLNITAAGTYSIACPVNSNYIFKVEVSWEIETCDHEGGTATCAQQAICSKCNTPYGPLSENHNFKDGKCTVCELPDPSICAHENMAPATCLLPATCECGYTEGDPLGHDIVADAAVAPTCTEKGLEAGEHCSRCDYKVEQKEIAALGHTLTFVNTVPTAEAAGKTIADCSVCAEHFDFGEVKVMTPGTYELDAAALDGIAQYSLFDGEVKVVGDVFACHLSYKYRTDANVKSFTALNWESTHRMNFGGASAFCNNGEGEEAVRNGGLKNYIQIVTTAETTLTFAWGVGGDNREIAVYDMEGNLVAVTEEKAVKNDLCVSTLTVPAGAYLIGSSVTDGGNYIYKMIVDVEAPHEHAWSDATCEEPAKCECGETQGEALGHKLADATCTEPAKCTVCNKTLAEALGHSFAFGKCTRCEAEDPDYEAPQPPVDGGDGEGEPPVEMNFFQKIIAFIMDLINKLLALFKK